MALKCIAVDDEPLALMLIEKYIGRIPELELVASYTSAREAHSAIAERVAPLAFLDIQMPGINGLQLAKEAERAGVRVVFTTAYPDYALEGFRVNAIDYLLKPISFEEFAKAVERSISAISTISRQENDTDRFLTVRSNYRSIRINYDDIVYIDGLRDYIKLHLAGHERPILTQMSMKSVEEQLPLDEFARIHRSYLVGLKHVVTYSRMCVTVENPSDGLPLELPIGATYRKTILSKLNG